MSTVLTALWLLGPLLGAHAAPPQLAPPDWLRPDTLLRPPAAIPLLFKSSPAEGLTTIRVFFPLDESFAEAGSGRVLARLVAERVAGGAARVGAVFTAVRTPLGIAYSVTGSDEDFDYLAWILRQAVREPDESDVVVRRWASRAEVALERAQETGLGWIQSDLLGRLCPSSPPETGLSPALAGTSRERLRRFWRRTHARERASVIVVTRAPRPVVLSALRTLGLPEGSGPSAEASVPPVSVPRRTLQVLRRWYGEARPLPRAAPAETRILGELLRRALGVSGRDYELFLEVRRGRCSDAVLVVGSAYRAGDRDMRARVSGMMGELTRDLSDAGVRQAAAGARRALVREVSSPSGLATRLGQEGMDAGDPEGLARLYDRLRAVDGAAMAAYLDQVAALTPLTSEVRP